MAGFRLPTQDFTPQLNMLANVGQNLRAEKRQNRLGELLGPAYSGDETAMNELTKLNPTAGLQLRNSLATQKLQLDESQRLQARQVLEDAANTIVNLPEEQLPQAWGQIRQGIIQRSPELAPTLPEGYSPEVLAYARGIARIKAEKPKDRYMNIGGNLIDLKGDPTTPIYSAPVESEPGFSATVGADGEIEFSYGMPGKLTTSTRTGIQKDIISAQDQLQKLRQVGSKISADYLTYEGRAKRAIGGIADKAGFNNDLTQFAAKSSAALQGVEQFFNAYRKDITGAAAAVQELAALKKAVINSDLGPSEFQARYNALIDMIESGLRQKRGQLTGEGQIESPPAQTPSQSGAVQYRYNAETGELEDATR